ncbi:MAG: efflux RND transporter permease subunit [Bacteroidaceae bacterium]|nr:efflux RND transporter permease subunit [Bacteroidaceae bacterium]
MLARILHFSLHNRLLVLVASVLVMVGGLYTTYHTEVDVFPDLNAPTVVVMTEANGMAAEEVEQLVTFPIETAVNGATYVRRVRSSSTNSFSIVWVEFDWGTDIYLARQIVSEKLSIVAEELPDNVNKPTLGPQSSILGELMIIGLTADSTSMLDLRTLADWTIRPRLLSMGGVAQVAVLGGDVKEYQILIDPARMRHYGVTIDEVLAATRDMNVNTNGGVLYEHSNEYIVRGMVSTTRVEEIGQAVVKRMGTMPVTLNDIAEVCIGAQEPKIGCASVEGKPAVLITVTKQPQTGTLELTEQIDRSLEEMKATLPADVKVNTDIFRQSRFIESSIGNVKDSLLEGALFVTIILALFLANARTTVISLVTLPLALLFSVLALHFMGLTINTMSLGGMAIAIGSLVDDAIVDVENVWKRLNSPSLTLPEGEGTGNASSACLPPFGGTEGGFLRIIYEASCEVRMPILNSTLIIVVSFIPLFFLSGMEGRMLVPLGVAFIVALFASTLVALTLTPVLCSYLLRSPSLTLPEGVGTGNVSSACLPPLGGTEGGFARFLKRYYRTALEWALAHKHGVLVGTIALFIAALVGFFTLGHSFLPSFNEGSFTINVSSLPGISLEESDRIGRRAEELLLTIPEIETVARKTGRAELDEHALGVNTSEIEAPFTLRDRSREELTAEVRQKLGTLVGANVEIGQPISHRIDAMLSGTKASIAIKLFGTDLNRMFALGNQIKEAVQDVEGIADLNVEQQIERPELKIVPRRQMLARYGITLPQFAEFVSVNMGGEVVSQVYEEGKTFDLVVRTSGHRRDRMEDVRSLMIDTPEGRIPLSYVADVKSAMGPNTISRENVKRKVVISANTSGRDLRSVVNDIQERIGERITLPEGYHIEYGGQFESEQAASNTLLLTSLMSIVIIYLLLYMEFKSARESAIILLNLPLALIGGILALLLTSGEMSIPAIIGLISLFGIATRNGMLLISNYNRLRASGMGLYDSVVEGSLDRLNPILMTALSSALAMIPLAINGDLPGNEIQSPMAKVILGGLLTSTFLNGFIIPIVYLMMNKGKGKSVDDSLFTGDSLV